LGFALILVDKNITAAIAAVIIATICVALIFFVDGVDVTVAPAPGKVLVSVTGVAVAVAFGGVYLGIVLFVVFATLVV